MPTTTLPSIHHVALTVTNLEQSMRWYERLFGVTVSMLDEPVQRARHAQITCAGPPPGIKHGGSRHGPVASATAAPPWTSRRRRCS
jgi:catechol 2,3-dioxygenase-like lactoylglutathione lyase family enzyme